jgi:predicted transcriptional regulator
MTRTTTTCIEYSLKARVSAAAERAGKTAHAFIDDAIAQTVEQEEGFHGVSDERWATLLASGKSVAWDEAKVWLEGRSRGEHPPRREAR